jgi:hypothetical protein
MHTEQQRRSNPLENLKQRQAQIEKRIQQLETRLNAKARKEDTRLKVLVGAAVLADSQQHPELKAIIRTTLDRAIKNAKDRQFLNSKGHLA